MTEAQIAAEATINSAWIGAIAAIIVALLSLVGIVYQVNKNRTKKNSAATRIKQTVKGNNNTVIGIQNNREIQEKNSGKRK